MSDTKRIFLSPPHMSGDEINFIKNAFDTNWIAPLGPHVEAFEREMANFIGVRAALALNSGTAALHLASELLDVGRGDLVIASTFTFAASVGPMWHNGARFAFIDSEPDSWNMSPVALERALEYYTKIGDKPKALVLVDLYGQSCDMDPLLDLAERYDVPVIEDAAEAVGSSYKGRKNGSFGKFAAISFNGNKIVNTSGGGMLLSDDEEAIARARFLSTQAREPVPWYQHETLGWNYRMSNILAGVGRAQLACLPERIAQKRKIFDRYVATLGKIPGVSFMPEPSWSSGNRWLSCMTLEDSLLKKISPMNIVDHLAKQNIETRPLWKPMHMQPVFEGKCDYWPHDQGHDFSGDLFARGLCLPSGTAMTEAEQDRVIAAVCEALGIEIAIPAM